jgi:chromosome segregation ATPase
MLENARMAAGISDGWLLDQIKPTELELKLKEDADRLIEELNQKRVLLEESNDAIVEQNSKIDELEAELNDSNKTAAELSAIQNAINEAKALIEQHNNRKIALEKELDANTNGGAAAKAEEAARKYAEEQYKRSRGIDNIDPNDQDAKIIIDRQVALQMGTVPQTTQMIMDATTAFKNEYNYNIIDLREDLEDGKIDDADVREMWNEVASAEVRVDSERTCWTMAS